MRSSDFCQLKGDYTNAARLYFFCGLCFSASV